MSPLRLEERVPEENQFRFHRLLLAPTLFGGWSLVREWGRTGRRGTVRTAAHTTEEEATAASGGRRARSRSGAIVVIRVGRSRMIYKDAAS